MEIRKTQACDLEALLAIYNDEVENGVATFDLHPKTMDEWQAWYDAHRVGNHISLTALQDGEAVGYATLSEYRTKEAYASTVELSVYVARSSRRCGAGRALMTAILQSAREDPQTHTVVSVITGENRASIALHEAFGFTYCGTLHQVGRKHGRYLDIVHYELSV